jgi:uncharacterized protein YuzE
MRLTYDKEVGAAYLRLRDDADDVGTVTPETFRPTGSRAGDDYFVFDFDRDGRLVGIEFLTPEDRLLPSVLARAEPPGGRPPG